MIDVHNIGDPAINGKYGLLSGPLSRLALEHASAIVGVSNGVREYVQRSVADRAKVHVVYMGVDDSCFAPGPGELPADLTAQIGGRHMLLSVSRLIERKGNDTVIRALPVIAETLADVVYVIVGDGPDRSRLEGVAREMRVQDRVVFAGGRHGHELVSLYQACDLFLMLARGPEGLGLSLIEAAACGRPVIVGDLIGQREALEDGVTGRLVPLDSPNSVSEACIQLLTDPDLADAMGRAGRTRAKSMSWDGATATLEKLLHSVILQTGGAVRDATP